MIANEDIIKSSSRIEDVLEYLGYNLNSRNRCPCPVHNGKDLNFAIHNNLGTCHSQCGKTWDAVGLIMEAMQMSYPTALRLLAKLSGISINEQELTELKAIEIWKTKYIPTKPKPKPKPINYLPLDTMRATFKEFEKNNFIRFLDKLFGKEKANQLAQLYNLGTSKKWKNNNGYSVIFWQVDRDGNIRQAKVMAYNPDTGKRVKTANGKALIIAMGRYILNEEDTNLKQCLFGEHLLNQDKTKTVGLVESEKTAVIMTGIMPRVTWLATGGSNGAKWTKESIYKVLEGRKVILYPDLDTFDQWKEDAKILGTICKYRVSDLLIQKAQGNDRVGKYDIADYFIKNLINKENLPQGWKRNEKGVLIADDGLPATWNLNPKSKQEELAIIQELNLSIAV